MSDSRLQYLLNAYKAKNCIPAEIQELNNLLEDDWARIKLGQDLPQVDWEKMYLEIMPGGRQETSFRPELKTKTFIMRKWWWAAAAIFIIAIGTAIVVSSDRQSADSKTDLAKKVSSSDLPPGGNKAVLTLANGQTIILDSAHNGLLAQQAGATITKTDSGNLAYSKTNEKPTDIVYNVLTTPRGGQYKLQLPDGTDVWLNSASSIKYPTAFVGNSRSVEVTGEAYFEVAKDRAKPFHVKVNKMEIEVLGTHFNINSYSEEGSIKTTLFEGSVSVTQGASHMTIKPGQQAEVGDGLTINEHPDLDQVMAWKNGLFNFEGADLKIVLRQLSRWYDVDVVYEGSPPARKFVGEISRDLTLSQVLEGFGEMRVKFKIDGKKLIVMP
jgi:transmembrane sensor